MVVEDVRRTFQAWIAQPLLPLIVLAFGVLGSVADEAPVAALGVLVPLGFLWTGFLGTQRVWYVRAWEGRGLRPGELFELSLGFVGRYWTLGILGLAIGILPLVAMAFTLGPVAAVIGSMLVVDVLFTFATSALALDGESPPQAVATSWRLLRAGFPRCLPHALLPPLALYALANERGWLFLLAETVALVARGVTTSYYVRETVRPDEPRTYEQVRDPAMFG